MKLLDTPTFTLPLPMHVESEQVFRALFEHSPVATTLLGDRQQFVRVNKAFLDLTDYQLPELLGKTLHELTHPDDRPSALAAPANLETLAQTNVEKRLLTKQAATIWVRVNATPIELGGASDLHMIAVIEDVTHLKKADLAQHELRRELEQQKDLLQSVMDASNAAIWAKRLDGTFLLVNKGFGSMVNLEPAAMLGKTARQLFPPSVADEMEGDDQLVVAAKALRTEEQYLTLGGVRRHVRVDCFPLHDRSGGVYATGGIATDISSEREAQKALIHSSKMSSLGEMAAGMAHEINNPLMIIYGKALHLRKQIEAGPVDPQGIAADLTMITATAERIATIVKGLLTFSHHAEDQLKESVAVAAVVADTLELCQEKFKNQHIAIRVNVSPDLHMLARAVQISQVLLNLLTNAADAIADLIDKWIEIAATAAGDYVEITVTDSGQGIAPGVAAKMMAPFFTTKAVGKGTGLGLSVSTGIIEDHLGRLSYDAAWPNTRFVISLPLG